MSPRTIFLARLIGLLAILSMAMHKQSTIETAITLIHQPPMVEILGVIGLICGLAMVISHDVWSDGVLPLVVTLVGWTILIRGAVVLFLPPRALISLFDALRLGELVSIYVTLTFLLGVYLAYAGFKASVLPGRADSITLPGGTAYE